MKAFSLLAIAAIITSCNSATEEKKNECFPSSFELSATGRDTINRLDCHGKQGIWVPTLTNKLKDTTYYRNDTIIG